MPHKKIDKNETTPLTAEEQTELLALIVTSDSDIQCELNELVCDAYERNAHDLNNKGPEAQIDWLVSQGFNSHLRQLIIVGKL